ncbi:histidyl-tRNA synthetase [Saccharothrix ecbatanensis]|uniref:Histidyl-tRNA synthetase n=1 Tax=Saccharothrix ecbatanensis TaxID=1105145 RepID=A0A7W9HDK9_9PSEU|nr:ATP phosphoribosyltransferase regulatory subunit [Saccharothrix ecbatanensis]MBB5800265.1 histidyl-tRNA synthetase [Saccharothrix ecbatanensis]
METPFTRTPRGFVDRAGEDVQRITAVVRSFQDISARYGFIPLTPAPVGYAETFERFGSAAHERMFVFPDRKERRLALTADSLPAVLRALHGTGLLHGGAPVAASGEVLIARYVRKPLRSWTHLTAVMWQHPVELAADLTLARLWTDVFQRLDVTFRAVYTDFGVVDVVAEQLGLGPGEARLALYRQRKAIPQEDDRAEELLDRLGLVRAAAQPKSDPEAALIAVRRAAPHLAERTDHIHAVLAESRRIGTDVVLDWSWQHGTQYHAGLSFLLRGADGRILADGGGYHHIVGQLDPGTRSCWSSAGGAERIAGVITLPRAPLVHLYRLGDFDADQFLRIATDMRAAGHHVREHWQPHGSGRGARRIPPDPWVWVALVGSREQEAQAVTVRNAADASLSFEVPLRSKASAVHAPS